MFKICVLLILILAVSACQRNAAENKAQTVKPKASATPNTEPTKPRNGNYNAKGVVTKINLELVTVELNHEKIEGLMEPMIMEFNVADKAELEKLKVGDKVDFVLEHKDWNEKIISIKKSK